MKIVITPFCSRLHLNPNVLHRRLHAHYGELAASNNFTMKTIPIWSDKLGWQAALVDDDNYERLVQYNWFIADGRAKRTEGSQRTRMHHDVIGYPPDGYEVDHKDRNPLNNQRENLHFVTHSFNIQNQAVNNPAGFKGVTKHGKHWKAQIKFQGVTYHIGTFNTAEEAAKARDAKAVELRGEGASVNFKP